MNGSPIFHFNPQHSNVSSYAAVDAANPSLSIPRAISRQLLLTGTPIEQRISGAGKLTTRAGVKLNGFANKAAEATAILPVSFTDYPHLKEAYDGYVAAAGVYKEVLEQLEPGSKEARDATELLLAAHKSCIKTIYLILDALEKAPGKKSSLPYMQWELRACESIREISALRGSKALRGIPELRH